MTNWIVTKTLRYEIDGASTAIDAIERTKTAKNWNVVGVTADATTIPSSARPNKVADETFHKNTDVSRNNTHSNVSAYSFTFVESQVENFSDGRLKNEWFKFLRDIAGTKTPKSEWVNYQELLRCELIARGLMNVNGDIISVSGIKTPRR